MNQQTEIAKTLLALDKGRELDGFFQIIGADEFGRDVKNKIKWMYSGLDEETTKLLAVKYSGIRGAWNMFDYEDRLCELMGDDSYFAWADENGIN